jgi:hypothetical protein
MRAVKRLFVLVLIGLVAASTAAAGSPRLRVAALSPLTVRGTGFAAHERVRVTVSGDTPATRRVLTGSAGGFVARFAVVGFGYCTASVIRAVGSTGDKAVLHVAAPECPQPPTP